MSCRGLNPRLANDALEQGWKRLLFLDGGDALGSEGCSNLCEHFADDVCEHANKLGDLEYTGRELEELGPASSKLDNVVCKVPNVRGQVGSRCNGDEPLVQRGLQPD